MNGSPSTIHGFIFYDIYKNFFPVPKIVSMYYLPC